MKSSKPSLPNSIQLCAVLLAIFLFAKSGYAQQKFVERNLLTKAFENCDQALLVNIDSWRSKEYSEQVNSIRQLPDSIKEKYIKLADEALHYNWPALTASLYLDYKHTGRRTAYEGLMNERRQKLSVLVAGEVITHNGRYISQIADGLWATLEESTWIEPAHVGVQKAGTGLPDIADPYIDLGATATAVTVAETCFLLHDELHAYSPVITKRVLEELDRRIFAPYLKYDQFWWMGFKGGRVNNWNIYNNANCLHAALLTMPSKDSLLALTHKILKSADKFVNGYPNDGGCDEGPSYWDMAGGRLIRLIALLQSETDGKFDLSKNELIHQIGAYIYKTHIAGSYMVNFADAAARSIPNPESVYRYGMLFNDQRLKQFAGFLFSEKHYALPVTSLGDFASQATLYHELTIVKPVAPYPAISLFPDLQVLTERSKEGSYKGLFVAIKGGNNDESHNHNDIGNFIVYKDGESVIIDAGVGTYTSKTFSSRRYELWNMQSQWHNCPVINGVEQKDGPQYKATGFQYSKSGGVQVLKMDISKAYPAEGEVSQWLLNFAFMPSKNKLTLTEDYQLKAYKAPSAFSFLTNRKVVQGKGTLTFGHAGVILRYNENELSVSVDKKKLDDERLIKVWGDKLYRIRLETRKEATAGKIVFEIDGGK
jgi:hypothetical protein